MMETGAPPIHEAVNLLDRFEPAALAQLRQRLPADVQPLLRPGGTAGKVDLLLVARAEVCLAALQVASARCAEAIGVAAGRLRLARTLRLVGGVAATLGSSSVLVSATAEVAVGLYLSGVVALVSSLTSLLADYLTRLECGASRTLFAVYADLVEKRYKAERLRGELTAHLSLKVTRDREQAVADLIRAANEVCLQVNGLVAVLLVDWR
jgi:hypothetical protein